MRLAGVTARHNLDLLGGRDDYFLRHVADYFVHHQHDGHAILFGEVESPNRQIEALLR